MKKTYEASKSYGWRIFDSELIDLVKDPSQVRALDGGVVAGRNRLVKGDLTLLLAGKFGFCYGVKLAIRDSLEALDRLEPRRFVMLNEMIHNPFINEELEKRGAVFLDRAGLTIDDLTPDDAVIIPAFGTTTGIYATLKALQAKGCRLVNTTCSSVVDVWNRVEEYNARAFTSVIHGKYYHEETIATASFARAFLIVKDMREAQWVCDFVAGAIDGSTLLSRFHPNARSVDFDPGRDLERVGMANQTTMRSSESEEIFARLESVYRRVYDGALDEHYLAMDTICRATEVRQQAVLDMAGDQLDVMLVIGGHNSSNTGNLARVASTFTRAFHIEDAADFDRERVRHKPAEGPPIETGGWLPSGPVRIGVTGGASTPDVKIGEVIEKLAAMYEFATAVNPA